MTLFQCGKKALKSTNINHKGLQRTANEYAEERRIDKDLISIAVFCLQNLICLLFIFADQVFIDPTFFGIFVCGPLQSFVVIVCTLCILRL